MLQSNSGDLFNFLMTTFFNTVKMIQPELREGSDLIQKYDLDKVQKIFSNNGI